MGDHTGHIYVSMDMEAELSNPPGLENKASLKQHLICSGMLLSLEEALHEGQINVATICVAVQVTQLSLEKEDCWRIQS